MSTHAHRKAHAHARRSTKNTKSHKAAHGGKATTHNAPGRGMFHK